MHSTTKLIYVIQVQFTLIRKSIMFNLTTIGFHAVVNICKNGHINYIYFGFLIEKKHSLINVLFVLVNMQDFNRRVLLKYGTIKIRYLFE